MKVRVRMRGRGRVRSRVRSRMTVRVRVRVRRVTPSQAQLVAYQVGRVLPHCAPPVRAVDGRARKN